MKIKEGKCQRQEEVHPCNTLSRCYFYIRRDRCRGCGKLLRKLRGLVFKDENGCYCLRQPSTIEELRVLEEVSRLCPFQAIIKIDQPYENLK